MPRFKVIFCLISAFSLSPQPRRFLHPAQTNNYSLTTHSQTARIPHPLNLSPNNTRRSPQNNQNLKMLRRKPTAITLTTEDVSAYEDRYAQEQHERAQEEYDARHGTKTRQKNQDQNQNPHQSLHGNLNGGGIRDPSDELRPLPGDRMRAQHAKTRDERLGLGIAPGGTGGSRG